ncbi:hypothetical protein NKOR_05080 [Candidatus Nitrosopumilus koreensis AR1]|uniref:Uncharacterized protein n=1 Tax=Candidatus Nitrosopumilus koreensis AR1 TaxID=1229908 RepID=K0B716_9ARCH|nr:MULTISPECIES: hypothetical protein [Nitrosopumilus]AFS80902.1 hypothetical protein NKOR_05080 [Candidatus Nitrosopumilus koreensis AR1]
MNDSVNIKEIIIEFIKNRSEINETTATRHIHRRFDISEEEIEKILEEFVNKNKIKKTYDEEYQENRFTT